MEIVFTSEDTRVKNGRERLINPELLDRDTFLLFVDPDGYIEERHSVPKSLDLGWCSRVQRDLIRQTKLVRIREEDGKKPDDLSDDERVARLTDVITALTNTSMKLQGVAERGSVIYALAENQAFVIGSTPPFHHTYDRTYANIGVLLRERKIPLISIHTHPQDVDLSDYDYYGMLIDSHPFFGNTGLRRRLLAATMVLTPSVQILTLPTPATPLMPLCEVDGYITRLSQEARTEASVVTERPAVLEMDDDLDEAMLRVLREQQAAFIEYTTRVRPQVAQGTLRQREYKDGLLEIVRRAGDDGQRLLAWLQEQRTFEKRSLLAFTNALARRLAVERYLSTDFRHFTRWSA